jgi:hypothetical protein
MTGPPPSVIGGRAMWTEGVLSRAAGGLQTLAKLSRSGFARDALTLF